jgi:hypothetical protein
VAVGRPRRGRRAWWLPTWLDRLLPTIDLEGGGAEDEDIAREIDGFRVDKPDEEGEPALVVLWCRQVHKRRIKVFSTV